MYISIEAISSVLQPIPPEFGSSRHSLLRHVLSTARCLLVCESSGTMFLVCSLHPPAWARPPLPPSDESCAFLHICRVAVSRKAEEYLIASGLTYTIIHPGGLLDKDGGKRRLVVDIDDAMLERKSRSIPRADVAQVCRSARALAAGSCVCVFVCACVFFFCCCAFAGVDRAMIAVSGAWFLGVSIRCHRNCRMSTTE